MGLVSNLETNAIGGGGLTGGYGFAPSFGFGGFGGGCHSGLGGIGLVGLLGLNSFLGRDGFRDGNGHCHDHGRRDGDCNNTAAILAAVASNKDTVTAEGRALAGAICDAEKTNLTQFYAQAVQSGNQTQSIINAITAQSIVNDKRFDDISLQISTDGQLTRALINQNTIQDLRDRLDNERRGRDLDVIRIENNNTNTNIQGQFQAQAQAQLQRELDDFRRRYDFREIEINNINTNTNIQAQAQAQSIVDLDREHRWNARFDALIAQNNKSNQDIVNLGTMVASGVQTPTQTNVNSKQS
jgi:hypothetical protein